MKVTKIDLYGYLGKALKLSCEQRLKTLDYTIMTAPFHQRTENDGAWRCEFWGKVTRSAILTAYYLRDTELKEIIRKTVYDMISAQTADGCISTYPTECQLGGWDIWGRKYVLIGMIRYYELLEKDPAVLSFCVRALDQLIGQIRNTGLTLRDYGAHEGLAACSILGAVIGVYRISGEKRFLEYAREIISSGCSKKHNIYESSLSGILPKDLGNAKAYEMTSCFQGLAEYYALEPDEHYREICLHYYEDVRQHEVYITGIAGNKDTVGELWNDGAFNQTRGDKGGLGETCVTVTWLHYIEQISRLTDASGCMDEAERSFYNGILGAMAPDGKRWIHCNPTPLTGGASKKPSTDQIGGIFKTPFDGHDCCRAQGPEGLALAPRLAVTTTADGAVRLNLFESLKAELDNGAVLEVTGNYPSEPYAAVRVTASGTFPLQVRIPVFCSKVLLNGVEVPFHAGSYLDMTRVWEKDDLLELTFDFTLREFRAPDGSPFTAVMRGPLVMAEDSRPDVQGKIATAVWRGKTLVDYATVGDAFVPENTLTVWFAD